MMTTTISPGALWTLAHFVSRDHAGRHFSEIFPDDQIDTLEAAGLIAVSRPVHQPTGIPYSPEYWTAEVTQAGAEYVDDHFDARDYDGDGNEAAQ